MLRGLGLFLDKIKVSNPVVYRLWSEIGKETFGSKQLIQFHCLCFEKWIKKQNFWEVVSNQRIKKQLFLEIDSNQRIKKQSFRFIDSNQWIKKHYFRQLFRIMNQEPVDSLFLCQSLAKVRHAGVGSNTHLKSVWETCARGRLQSVAERGTHQSTAKPTILISISTLTRHWR